MNNMKISIITVSRNSAVTIRDTLESVQRQDYPHVEHIVIDGLSTDETMRIVHEYPHVAKLVSESDSSLYEALNKGIRQATGDVVGILHSDDVYADEAVISRVADAFHRTDCEAVYGDLVYVDRTNPEKVIRHWRAGAYKPDAFKWGWTPPHTTLFVKRNLYERYGGFDPQFGTAADYEFMLRFVHKHHIKLVYLPSVLVKMRTGGLSNQTWMNRFRANVQDRRAWTANHLQPFWFTRYLKPLRKISQFTVFRR